MSESTTGTQAPSLHHVAYACKDPEQTRHFYEDLMGFPLVHTEVAPVDEGFMRHLFFALDDGSCVAFFDVHNAGESEDWSSAISTGNGLPIWVNHLALRATSDKQDEVLERMRAEGSDVLMILDHSWCISHYYLDPNGILVELCRDNPGMPIDPVEARELLSALPDPSAPHAEARLVEAPPK